MRRLLLLLLANGFRWTRHVGDRVDLVTAWGVVPGVIEDLNGSETIVRLSEDWERGYSGAGLWYGDDWLAGVVTKGDRADRRRILADIPFVEHR